MMRAALIVVGLSILVTMEIETPPRTTKAASEPPLAPSTVGVSQSRDTLTKADRLEITYMQHEAQAPLVSPVERTPEVDSIAVLLQQAPKIIDRHRRAANAKKVAVVLPKPRPRHTASRRAKNTDRAKATIEVKSCRPNAFGSLLKALNLAPGCET